MTTRKAYPSDVSDEEWAFVAPYLALLTEEAPPRQYPLREVFNALRWLVRTGSPWPYLPRDFPPWEAVYPQTQRWIRAGCFEAIVQDLRELLRQAQERAAQPTVPLEEGRPLQSTPESGNRAGDDRPKRCQGSQVPIAGDTLGSLLAALVTPAQEQEREQVGQLAQAVQEATGETVEVAFVDPSYTGEDAARAAPEQGLQLEVVKLPQAKQGLVLLPRRWVVERSFAWAARFRRLARDYERLPETVAALPSS